MADLRTKIAGVEFRNPLIGASGTFGYGNEYGKFFKLSEIGGFVTKGISLLPKTGNKPPRIAETPAGMLNAIGLENVGLDKFLAEKLPAIENADCRVIVNIFGTSVDEYAEVARRLDGLPGVDAVECNISCPNVKEGCLVFGATPQGAAEVTAAVRKACRLPVWVKLSPNVGDIGSVAAAVEDAGADAVSLINTVTGLAVDLVRRRPILGNITGGLSGPAIKPIALRMVWEVSNRVTIPVVGIGGIRTAEDVAEFILVGAAAVQVGTANFIDPATCSRLPGELAKLLDDLGCEQLADLRGKLEI